MLLEVTELPGYTFLHFATHKPTYVTASRSIRLVDNRSGTCNVTGCCIHRNALLHHFETKSVTRGHFVFLSLSKFSSVTRI
jgi:hypothetical protein